MGVEQTGYKITIPSTSTREAALMVFDRKDAALTSFWQTMNPATTWISKTAGGIVDMGGLGCFYGVAISYRARKGGIFRPVELTDWQHNMQSQKMALSTPKEIRWLIDAPYPIDDFPLPPTARALLPEEFDTVINEPSIQSWQSVTAVPSIPHPALEELIHQEDMPSIECLRKALQQHPLLQAQYFLAVHEYCSVVESALR